MAAACVSNVSPAESLRICYCVHGRREMKAHDESNNAACSRRRSLLPASELRLEVPCFGVRPAAGPVSCDVTQRSLPAVSDDDDQRGTVSVPLPTTMRSTCSAVKSDEEQFRADDTFNANISGELSAILSRAASLIEHALGHSTATSNLSPVNTAALLSSQTSVPDASHESMSSLLTSSAVPDRLVTANTTKSVVRRGRIRGRRTSVHDRDRPAPFSTRQTLPVSLDCTTTDLMK